MPDPADSTAPRRQPEPDRLPKPDWEAFYASYRKPGYVPGYEITHKLGGGAFGVVYRARKQSIGKDYAIKFLKVDDDAEVRRGVLAELDQVSLFAQVDHPNLVAIEDRGVVDGIPYVVMGYAGSETLEDRLKAGGGAAAKDELLRLFLQACRGVQALHERSLVHFDVKPANVFVKGGIARIGDYGLSRLTTHSRASLSMGRGTPYYMAPELLQRRGDWRSDIYALGVILYQILVGSLPFLGDSEWEVLRKHCDEAPTIPASVAERERLALQRCLAKEPAQRFQSVAELMNALGATPSLVGAAWTEARPPRTPPPPPKAPTEDPLRRAAHEAKLAAQKLVRETAASANQHARRAMARALRAARAAERSAASELGPRGPWRSGGSQVSGFGIIARAHWRKWRADRARRRAERLARRRSKRVWPWIVVWAIAALGFSILPVSLRRGVESGAASATATGSPARLVTTIRSYASAAPLAAALPAQLRPLISLKAPGWLAVSALDVTRARSMLSEHLDVLRTGLPLTGQALQDFARELPDFGPLDPGSVGDPSKVSALVQAVAKGGADHALAVERLSSGGRAALDAAAIEIGRLSRRGASDADRRRAARLHAFLCEQTGIDFIAFDVDSEFGNSVLRANSASATLWRWVLHEIARSESAWEAYRRLAGSKDSKDGR